ncbi:MAG: ATP-binding cassette domain-containing protein [Caldilineae bacterium]|nr:ATP-binding cassette domain-containing protein [Anaerolineae bacterium]MCB0199840.1 ATP-binding cassette domain-containing protein [Anaerolineae bacterium]MCB0255210.1 ATP-binding cassette domain-containing protein [Anaerolineae bacterium]MCB9141616.1 ATP-binding cassette domain-containing protein [Anaerolineales bacterium]MCB9155273.1 ATP-binding cassette domain-containing protein [Caldilineae bacterium]
MTTQSSTPTVQITGVRKSFGAVRAVDDVSFDVYPGEIFGMLGPNGAGKTTTIRLMLDIFRPDAGKVAVFGGPMEEEKKNRIGYMPEERGMYRDQKLESTLVYFARLKGMDEDEARDRLAGWLQRLDLYDHRQKRVQDLSKGMQQKAQIISTLVHEPDLIIIDEPFSGLDPVNTRLVKEIIEEQRQAGRTIIMSTHQMYQVEALCNRIVLIDKGRSVLYGAVDEIKRRFAGNAVLIEGEGDFTSVDGVLDAYQRNGAWHLPLAAGISPQEVLRSLASREDVHIERFEVAEASLDDIFVMVVQGETPDG